MVYSLGQQWNSWQNTKIEYHIKNYNETRIPQFGVCSVIIKHKDKQKLCKYYVVPENGPALLEISDIEILDILSVKCSIIELHRQTWEIINKE